jgi:hypothetical protein
MINQSLIIVPSDRLDQIQSSGSSLVDNPILTGMKEGLPVIRSQ